ncbi:hypothetical protein ANCCAN_16814 [Ancylostoma caninum]|uniref:Uncharacterized protein n=1 Tax=Ancylostoma caninum TaxID=29170 RepID=A0A368G3U7_ANCCA|nr:hypothetical protein ANCCAN_16814 [Ancylostoma caninum]
MWEECEELAKKSHYNKCSIAVPLILDNEEIKNKIKVWDVEYNLDQVPVQRYCWDACLKAILKPN